MENFAKDFTMILRWMYNHFDRQFMIQCFDDEYLADHIWEKFLENLQYSNRWDALMTTFLNVDSYCQEAMINKILAR